MSGKRIVTINNMPPSKQTSACRECGHVGPANEYHPYAFCILYKENYDPWVAVREAAEAAGWIDALSDHTEGET